jgi:hypothetical protein
MSAIIAMILTYDGVQNKPKTLMAMTSLNAAEFEELCTAFNQVWIDYTHKSEIDPTKGGRMPILKTMQDRLFFILFYLKVYPLQEVLAHLFGMSQGQANFHVRRAKALSFSGCESRPATFAPAGSNWSSRGGNETAGASGVEGSVRNSVNMQAVI